MSASPYSQQTRCDARPSTSSSSAIHPFSPFTLFPPYSHPHAQPPTSLNSNSPDAAFDSEYFGGLVGTSHFALPAGLVSSASSDLPHPTLSALRPTASPSSQLYPPFDPHTSAITPSSSWKEGEWDAACPFASESSSAGKQKRNKKTQVPVESRLVLAGSLDEGRAQKACKACRARKSRCDGNLSCLRCETSGTLCVYPVKIRVPRPVRKRRQPSSSIPLPPCFTTKVLEHRPSFPTPVVSSNNVQRSPELVHRSPGRLSSTGSEGGGSRDSWDESEDASWSQGESRDIAGRTTVKDFNSYLNSQEDLSRQHPTDLYQTSPHVVFPFGSPLSPPLSHDPPFSSYPPSFEYFEHPTNQIDHPQSPSFGLPSPLLSYADASSFINNNSNNGGQYPSHPYTNDPSHFLQPQNNIAYPFPSSWETASFGSSPHPQRKSSWISQFGGDAPVQLPWGEGCWNGASFSG